MSKILYLDYVALIIYALMIITFLLRNTRLIRKRAVFVLLIFLGFFATLYDICSIWIDNRGEGAIVLSYIINIGYLALRSLIPTFFCVYMVSATDTWHRLRNNRISLFLFVLPVAVEISLIFTSPITHFAFYINENGTYVRGPLIFILYIVGLYYLFIGIYYAARYYRLLGLSKFLPLISIVPTQLISLIVQYFRPTILCEMLASVLCLLLIMLTIEKPDSLLDRSTDLYNRTAFMDMLIRAEYTEKPLSVVFINITNYSALNSYLSFSNMNLLYKALAARLETVKTDLSVNPEVYNLTKGLFAAVFSNEEKPFANKYAFKILDALHREYPINNFSVSAPTTVCIVNLPDDMSNIDQVRLFIKDFVRSRFTGDVTHASMITKNKDYAIMADMDNILKDAIENDLFEVYYQPIYSVSEKRFNSAEALIRLNSKEHGFIRPDLFIPMAEESGLINKIGLIVFEKVCRFISSDEFKTLGIDYIEVNLSVVQCMDKDLTLKIAEIINKYGVKPSQINLEITETASTLEQKNMIMNIIKLNEMGFEFSLDDFGTGYSNMVRIASLPLNIIKLDRSFTWTENNPKLKLILENTIRLVKKMNMKIVVEGVETEEMLNSFIALDCDYIQGYYFSKPLPQNEFSDFIKRNKI